MKLSNSLLSYHKCFVLLLLVVLLFGCKKEKPIIYKIANQKEVVFLNKWLVTEANFDKPEYKEKFDAYYNEGLKTKNYTQCSDALLSVYQVMVYRGLGYDNYYYEVLKKYVEKHEKDIFIDHLFSFYAYLGSVETFNSEFQMAIKTFEKLSKFEPYNYTTFTDMGYAYYYISCNYYYLGDYVKSLEKIKKASFYFNQTDNYSGQALVENRTALLNFTTKNTEEALKSIDKTLKIYEKVLDPFGKANAMLYKYDYLSEINLVKANQYLDTITVYITKNDLRYPTVLLKYNHIKIKKFIREKNIDSLDRLLPVFEKQVEEVNINEWKNLFETAIGWYQLSKYKKLNNQKELLKLLEMYKENNDYLMSVGVLELLKDDAFYANNLQKLVKYDTELEQIEKKLQQEELQLKVKVFEKKIDSEKKAKIIAQQKNKISQNNNYIFGLVALVLIIVITFWIISLKRNRNKAQEKNKLQEQFTFQLLQNTEEERSRIANELHDSVNHDLLNIKNKLTQEKSISVNEVENVITDIRNISRNLYPAVLQNLGLEASIESLCERVSNESNLFTTCELEYTHKLNKSQELQLYRIIQEALNNTLKHGKANAAKVILTSDGRQLYLEIKDNGSGFNYEEKVKSKNSFGLQSILQRAKAVAAKIDIKSNQFGTIITLKIPT